MEKTGTPMKKFHALTATFSRHFASNRRSILNEAKQCFITEKNYSRTESIVADFK
jgi:hypothetical protein